MHQAMYEMMKEGMAKKWKLYEMNPMKTSRLDGCLSCMMQQKKWMKNQRRN